MFFMFLGEFSHTIDNKKRLAIPSKFRPEIGRKGVLTIGFDNCLFLYPLKEWQKLANKLSSLPLGQVDVRALSRVMLSGAMEVEIDNLGRVLIPDYLKKYAGLKKEVVITGVLSRIEIWDKIKWQAYKSKVEKTVGDMADKLSELGL